MKTIIYYIFFLGVFFTYPCSAISLQSKQDSGLSNSFQKKGQEYAFSPDDLKNLILFFDDDFFNDEDENVSIKRKIVFTCSKSFGNNQFIIKPFYKNLRNNLCFYKYFSHSLFPEFISLRVLKL